MIAALLLLAAAGQDIVVSAPRLAAIDPAAVFAAHCFDPGRLRGRWEPPPEEQGWRPLDAATRARFAIPTSPSTSVWGIVDGGRALILEQGEGPASARDGGKTGVVDRRCAMTVIGDPASIRLVGAMNRLFRAGGTERHVGTPDGIRSVPGWRQWAWTATPPRGASAWRGGERGRFTVVVDRSYYDNADYVVGEVKVREQGEPWVAVMSLTQRLVPLPRR